MGDGSPKAKLMEILQPREIDSLTSLVELMETQGFGIPTSSADKKSVYGFRYWLPSSTTEGFEGKNPSGFSDKAGIDADTNTRWRSYTGAWDTVSREDLIALMKRGYRKIRWKAPITTKDAMSGGPYSNYKLWMQGDTFDDFELIAEGQNENLGKDVAPYNGGSGVYKTGEGDVMFKRHPVCWVPSEDDQSDNSVWMINMDCFDMIVCRGNVLRRSAPKEVPFQHNDYIIHVDLTWNIACYNCRENARFIQN